MDGGMSSKRERGHAILCVQARQHILGSYVDSLATSRLPERQWGAILRLLFELAMLLLTYRLFKNLVGDLSG